MVFNQLRLLDWTHIISFIFGIPSDIGANCELLTAPWQSSRDKWSGEKHTMHCSPYTFCIHSPCLEVTMLALILAS